MDTSTHAFLEIDPMTIKDFQRVFDEIAQMLMTNYALKIKDNLYALAEIEFYLNEEMTHPDVFAHSDETQLTCNQWYFHRTGKSYRGGNYKGLDMTFGTAGYGGILIRAIKHQTTNEYVDGPCKVVDKILSLTDSNDIISLVGSPGFQHHIFSDGILSLVPSNIKENLTIYQSARFGLTLRNQQQSPFVIKPYRYMSLPQYVKKGKQHLVLELHSRDHDTATISKITNSTEKQCEKWISRYRKGFAGTQTPEDYFNKSLKVDEFSEFYGVMKRQK